MEYEFTHDPITGNARANFSMEHEVMGPWLEVEVGQSIEKLEQLLTVVEKAEQSNQYTERVIGNEYNALISHDDVIVCTNNNEQGEDDLPDAFGGEALDFDQNNEASCGLDDFKLLLTAWYAFAHAKR